MLRWGGGGQEGGGGGSNIRNKQCAELTKRNKTLESWDTSTNEEKNVWPRGAVESRQGGHWGEGGGGSRRGSGSGPNKTGIGEEVALRVDPTKNYILVGRGRA